MLYIISHHLICMLRLRTLRRMSGASPVVVRGWTDWKTMRNLEKYWFLMVICVNDHQIEISFP